MTFVAIKSVPPPLLADSCVTNAEVVKAVVVGSVIKALVSILRVFCQCNEKHSSLNYLYEWLGIGRGKVA
jgi:hypothetical protein